LQGAEVGVTKIDMSVEEWDKMVSVLSRVLKERLMTSGILKIDSAVRNMLFMARGDSVDSGTEYVIRIQYSLKVDDIAKLLKWIREGRLDSENLNADLPIEWVVAGDVKC
jgi:hypothetical protein